MNERMEEQRKARRAVLIAVALSLALHAVIVLCTAWFFLARSVEPPELLPEDLTITMIEPPPAPAKPLFVDTSAPESAAPENSVFESDRNTAAASPDVASGAAPLPTQEGVEQPALSLEQQELALAKPDAAPPAPEMPPAATAAAQPAQPEQAPPEQPEEIRAKPEADGIAIAAPPRERPEKSAQRQPPPALPPPRPSYRPQTRATRLSGSVSNRGKAAVAALSTPLGRYRKQISDAIGSSWYYHIGSRMDMFSLGTIKVLFDIEKDGKARNPRVLSNTSNESFEIVTIESIRSAEIPPIPPDVLPILDGGRIEIDFSFSIISY